MDTRIFPALLRHCQLPNAKFGFIAPLLLIAAGLSRYSVLTCRCFTYDFSRVAPGFVFWLRKSLLRIGQILASNICPRARLISFEANHGVDFRLSRPFVGSTAAMADQAHAMEYTLQGTVAVYQRELSTLPNFSKALLTLRPTGVMRFLQVEWHNHERARNAWDIERAEMKAKIAKQEGDYRSAKKLNESLDRQIRMLERAVKHERAKNKAVAAGEKFATEEEAKKEWSSNSGTKRRWIASAKPSRYITHS